MLTINTVVSRPDYWLMGGGGADKDCMSDMSLKHKQAFCSDILLISPAFQHLPDSAVQLLDVIDVIVQLLDVIVILDVIVRLCPALTNMGQ